MAWLWFTGLVLVCIACDLAGDFSQPNPPPTLAFPLGQASFEVESFVSGLRLPVVLTHDATGLLELSYRTELFSLQASGWMDELVQRLPGKVPLWISPMDITLPVPEGLDFSSLEFRAGQLEWRWENPFPEPVSLTISLPFTDPNGHPVRLSFELPPYEGVGEIPYLSNAMQPMDLARYTMPVRLGRISLSWQAKGRSGKSYGLPGAWLRLGSMELGSVRAVFRGFPVDLGSHSLLLDFLKPLYRSKAQFDQPKLRLFFAHDIAIPLQVMPPAMRMILPDGSQEALPFLVGEQPVWLNQDKKESGLYLDTLLALANPNPIQTIFERKADALHYNLKARLGGEAWGNPMGVIGRENRVQVVGEVKMPLSGRIMGHSLSDTLPLRLGLLERAGWGKVRLQVTNTIPLGISGQCYFLDASGRVLDSLVSGAPVVLSDPFAKDSDGSLVWTEIGVTDQQMKVLRRTDRLVVQVFLSTPRQGAVSAQLRKGQRLSLKMSLLVHD